MTEPILSVRGVSKTYASGVHALSAVDPDINKGKIFALLGPNGAGKTTLIGIICGIVTPSTGTIAASAGASSTRATCRSASGSLDDRVRAHMPPQSHGCSGPGID